MLLKPYMNLENYTSSTEALEIVKKIKFDIVFMDMYMPEMDGLEATRKIVHSQFPTHRPKIIALTADSMSEDKIKCLEAGMDDYITKPVRIEEILSILNRWAPVPLMPAETFISQMKTVRKQPIPPATAVFQVYMN